MVDPAPAEPGLGDGEPLAPLAEQVVGGDPDVVVANVRVSGDAPVAAVQADVADDLDARRVGRHDEHRHAPVRLDVGIGDRQHDQERGEAGVGREPLLAVDHPLVAVALGAGRELRRVRPAGRLGHRERRHHLLGEQRFEVALLQLRGAVAGEDLGVAGVGRLAAEHDRPRMGPAEDLVEQRQLDLPETLAAEMRAEVARPQPALAHPLLERGHEPPAHRVVHVERVTDHEVERLDLVRDEPFDPVELGLELGFGGKAPAHPGSPGASARDRVMIARYGRAPDPSIRLARLGCGSPQTGPGPTFSRAELSRRTVVIVGGRGDVCLPLGEQSCTPRLHCRISTWVSRMS